MPKRGTASESNQDLELVAAVIRAIPVKDMPEQQKQYWIEGNTKELKERMLEALCPFELYVDSEEYEAEVNYGLDEVDVGSNRFPNLLPYASTFPTARHKGKATVVMQIGVFNRYVQEGRQIAEMLKHGFRPAEAAEMVALSENTSHRFHASQHPFDSYSHRIYALGSKGPGSKVLSVQWLDRPGMYIAPEDTSFELVRRPDSAYYSDQIPRLLLTRITK
jgi:hypothetical protein